MSAEIFFFLSVMERCHLIDTQPAIRIWTHTQGDSLRVEEGSGLAETNTVHLGGTDGEEGEMTFGI